MKTISHRVALIIALAYFAALVGILFWPSPVDRPINGTLTQLIKWLQSHGMPGWFINYHTVEFTANIALFIPFGVILVLRLHRRLWWLVLPISAAASGLVELAQGILLPGRFSDWRDIAANASGALLGALLVLFIWSLRRRQARRVAQART